MSLVYIVTSEANRGTQVVGSIPTGRNKIFDNFISSLHEAKRGVDFHHLIRNASRTRQKVENLSLTENGVA